MTLYVANSTKQTIKHCYRLPGESPRPRVIVIPSGQQVSVPGVASQSDADYVIRDLERYGARNAKELNGKSVDKFPGLIYSIDKPVSVENIEIGHAAVVDHQERRAANEAVTSAKAFDVTQRDRKTKKRLAKVTEVSVSQDLPRGQRESGDEVKMTVTVAEDGKPD